MTHRKENLIEVPQKLSVQLEIEFLPSSTRAVMLAFEDSIKAFFEEYQIENNVKLVLLKKMSKGYIKTTENVLSVFGDYLDSCEEVQNYRMSILYRIKKQPFSKFY